MCAGPLDVGSLGPIALLTVVDRGSLSVGEAIQGQIHVGLWLVASLYG